MGTCFGIVPYVDGPNTGTIAGIVGAGKETALNRTFCPCNHKHVRYSKSLTILLSLVSYFKHSLGGNVGAILFMNVFRNHGDTAAFDVMGTFSILASLLTPMIVIKGYRGILFGREGKLPPTSLLIGAAEVAPLARTSETEESSSVSAGEEP